MYFYQDIVAALNDIDHAGPYLKRIHYQQPMKQRISLSGKLILNFLLVSIAAIAIVGILSYLSSEEAIRQRTLDHLTSVCSAKKNSVTNFFRDRVNELKFIRTSEEMIIAVSSIKTSSIAGKNLSGDALWSPATHLPTMIQYLKSCGYYDGLCICDTLNHVAHVSLSTGDNIAIKTHSIDSALLQMIHARLESEKNTVIISDYQGSEGKIDLPLMISTRITDANGALLGWMSLELNQRAIDEIMIENDPMDGLGHTGETYLVGPDSLLRSRSRFEASSVLHTKVSNEALKHALLGQSGTSELMDYRSKKVLNAHSPINIYGLQWVIMAEIDYNEAMISVFELKNKMLWLSLIVVLVISIYFYLVSKRITLPVIRLKKAAEKIGKGDFETQLEIRSHDEIGTLTGSFNQMAVQLKGMTNTLKEREERLTHFYDATLDGIVLHEENWPLLVNQAMVRMTGYSEADLMKMEVPQIFQIEKSTPFRIPLRPFTYETIAYKKDKSTFPVEVQVSAIEYRNKMIFASVLRDITRRREFEKELQEERLKRLSWVIDGQEIERERLSRELHDGLGQLLVGIKLKLESTLDNEDEKSRGILRDLGNMFDKTIEEIRRISNNIMPSGLQEFGIVNALRKLCDGVSENAGIPVLFSTKNFPEQIPGKTILYLFRIAQEAINNSVKHSQSTQIEVSLTFEDGIIKLLIRDNGKGFKYDKTHKFVGNGLYNMRERVNMMQGSFEIISAPDQGTSVSVNIPWKKED